MPTLIAPIFNTRTTHPFSVELPGGYHLLSGNDKLYEVSARYLRKEMDENRHSFDRKVSRQSLFLVAEYPHMKVTEDRDFIQEIENKLNLASESGVCSIPYVMTADSPHFGITYLKRSLEGNILEYEGKTRETFTSLLALERPLPTLAYRRYMLSLEKESNEDQLLDLWIALESLFVPDGKKGEITYKLRLRMAYYFSETYDQRMKIAEFIKSSYNHRSEIVHSGKSFGTDLQHEVHLLRKMARAALLNMSMEGVTLQDIKVRLDQLIMSGESYRKRYAPAFFENVELE